MRLFLDRAVSLSLSTTTGRFILSRVNTLLHFF